MPLRSTVTLSSNGKYWQAQYYDLMGRRRAKSLGPKSKLSRRQAKVKCDRLAAEMQLNPAKASGSQAPKLGDFLERYLASRTDLKPGSLYLQDLTGRYLKQFFGTEIRINRITRAMASDWRTALAKGDLKQARKNHQYDSMNETTVCGRVVDAITIFNAAVADDLITVNPFDRLNHQAPKPDKQWHYVSVEELDKLLNACPTAGWKALIALCRLAGLRRGEALALEWTGVDWQNRRLTVYAQKTERHGDNKRIVPIEPKLFQLLAEVRKAAPTEQVRVCNVTSHSLWRNFQVIRKRAELPAWADAFQVMRRNAETDWAQRFPQYAVSEWLGHDITVSDAFYLAVPEELYTRAAAG
jgi:integrase